MAKGLEITDESEQRTKDPSQNQPISEVSEEIFRNWVGFFPYTYQIDEKGRETVEEWKRGVEEIIGTVKRILSNEDQPLPEWCPQNLLDKKRVQKALGDNPSEKDVLLFSIGTFVKSKYKKFSFIAAGAKIARGGTFKLASLEKSKSVTCIDCAVMTQELAKAFGVSGNIIFVQRNYHHYWQEAEGEKSIVDTTACSFVNGFVKDPNNFLTMIRENKIIKKAKRSKKNR